MFVLLSLVSLSFISVQGHTLSQLSTSLEALRKRQTSLDSIPEQCQTDCNTIATNFDACTTLACICTIGNADSLESCADCLVKISPTIAMITEEYDLLVQFSTSCTGYDVPTLVLSANDTSLTASASGSSSEASLTLSDLDLTATAVAITTASTKVGVSTSAAVISSSTSSSSDSNPFDNTGINAARYTIISSDVAVALAVVAGFMINY